MLEKLISKIQFDIHPKLKFYTIDSLIRQRGKHLRFLIIITDFSFTIKTPVFTF